MLNVVGKIYAEILVDRVRRMTEGFIDDEQKGFKAGKWRVDQIFTLKQIGKKLREREKSRVYVGFIDLEKVYDKVNRKFLLQELRMYDVGCKLLIGIKSMYVDGSACVRVKEGEIEWSRINIWVRQGCIMSLWLFNVYMDGVGRREMRFVEDRRKWRLPGLLNTDDLVLCGESEGDGETVC